MTRPAFLRRGWVVLPLLAVVYVLAVLSASRWLDGVQLDLTQDHVYTLSPGTRGIIDKIQQPLDLTLYFSDRASRGLPQLRAYHQRVVELLEEVTRAGHGRVRLRQVDPTAYSEAEDRAVAAGVTSVRDEGSGEPIFFGLVGRTADGRSATVPVFLLARQAYVEYTVARLLYELGVQHKPRVAVFSGLPIWGGSDDAGNAAPPWAVVQQLRQLFDVQTLDAASLARLDDGVDVLVLIQPADLSDVDVRAVDRYVQSGGHLLVFVDPDSEVGGGAASSLARLFKAWGVGFDPDRVLLDRSRALKVQSPVTGEPEQHPAVLGLTRDALNPRDPVVDHLDIIDVSSTGYFTALPGATTRLVPLIQSTTEAMPVAADTVRNAVDPATLLDGYRPAGTHFAIAVRVAGALPALFANDAAVPKAGHKPEVIVVGDTDVLSDRLWVQAAPASGPTLFTPFASNGAFFINAVDDLAGPSDLIAIRGRAVEIRTFTRVERLRRRADDKFKAKQQELQVELADTEERLAALRKRTQGVTAQAAQKAAVAEFERRKLKIRGELREVQRQLDADIERLSARLKFIDILLMPMLVTLLALLYGGWRLHRRRHAQVARGRD